MNDVETNVQEELELEEVDFDETPEYEDEIESTETDDSEDSDGKQEEEEFVEEPPDVIEVDVDGERYEIPSKLKSYFEDETSLKTQRADFEKQQNQFTDYVNQQQQVWEAQAKAFSQFAELHQLDATLERYDQVDWERWLEQDMLATQKAQLDHNKLLRRRADLVKEITAEKQKNEAAQMESAKSAVAKAGAELKNKIPNWGKQVHTDLVNFVGDYGISQHEMSTIYDPRVYQIIYDAYQYKKSVNKASVKPKAAAKPTQKVRGKPKSSKSLDDMSMAEFVAYRNKQAAKR